MEKTLSQDLNDTRMKQIDILSTRLEDDEPLRPSDVAKLNLYTSDIRILHGMLRDNYQGQDVQAELSRRRERIHETPIEIEKHSLFSDLKGDTDFREWCSTGADPFHYPC